LKSRKTMYLYLAWLICIWFGWFVFGPKMCIWTQSRYLL